MENFEGRREERGVVEVMRTPRGLECEVALDGNQYRVVAQKVDGPYYVVSGTGTRGLPLFDDLPEDIREAVIDSFRAL